jgi:hypothetical protein
VKTGIVETPLKGISLGCHQGSEAGLFRLRIGLGHVSQKE